MGPKYIRGQHRHWDNVSVKYEWNLWTLWKLSMDLETCTIFNVLSVKKNVILHGMTAVIYINLQDRPDYLSKISCRMFSWTFRKYCPCLANEKRIMFLLSKVKLKKRICFSFSEMDKKHEKRMGLLHYSVIIVDAYLQQW